MPIGWWSGWGFESIIAESGASYCFQAIDGLDWAMAQLGDVPQVDHIVVVRGPGPLRRRRPGRRRVLGRPRRGRRQHPGRSSSRRSTSWSSSPAGTSRPPSNASPRSAPTSWSWPRPRPRPPRSPPPPPRQGWDGLLVGMAPSYSPCPARGRCRGRRAAVPVLARRQRGAAHAGRQGLHRHAAVAGAGRGPRRRRGRPGRPRQRRLGRRLGQPVPAARGARRTRSPRGTSPARASSTRCGTTP